MSKNLFESPFFKKFSKLADFFLGSLYFLICSIPVITLVPSLCALYYAMSKAVRYESGDTTTKTFFLGLKQNLKQGLLLSLLAIAAGVILYTMYDVARGVGFATVYGTIYLILIPVYLIAAMAVFLAAIPLVTRFRIRTLSAFKLALSMIRKHPFRMLTYVIAFFGIIFLSLVLPPLTLILPGGYMYSLTYLMEPMMMEYIDEHPEEAGELPDWLKEALEKEQHEESRS